MQIEVPARLRYIVRSVWLFVIVPVVFFCIWLVIDTYTFVPAPFALAVLLAGLMFYLWIRLHLLPQRYAESMRAVGVLANSQAELAYLFEQSPVAYLKMKADGTIIKANLAAVRLLGSTIDEVNSYNLYELFAAAGDSEWQMLRTKSAQGLSESDTETKLATATGVIRWVRISSFMSGHGSGVLVTLVDITQQKKIDQAKSEFVALASHQLRTPIAAISWNAELLGMTAAEFTDKQRSYCEKIVSNAERMKALIDDFLSVSQLETGTFQADVQTVDFSEYLSGIIDEFESFVTEKQLQVVLDTPDTPLQWNTDQRLLHIITSNLISNAMKYTPADGVVRIGYQVTETGLVFSVADSGIGIPSTELGSLFTKFYRATNARKHRSGGTGLGLYIVKQSVEMLGGTIDVASEENRGTVFTISVPL